MGTNLLHYRGWTGQFRGPFWSMLTIARVALSQVFRRKLFWVLYAFGLLFFFMFFFGQYLLAWTESQMDEQVVTVGVFRTEPAQFVQLLRKSLRIDGSGEMYRNFFRFQASMVVVILAMAGAVLVGNDFQFGCFVFSIRCSDVMGLLSGRFQTFFGYLGLWHGVDRVSKLDVSSHRRVAEANRADDHDLDHGICFLSIPGRGLGQWIANASPLAVDGLVE